MTDRVTAGAAPKRIQRKRTNGWRMPEGAVYVGRPTIFGNPVEIGAYWDSGYSGSELAARRWAVEQFNLWTAGRIRGLGGLRRVTLLARLHELRGKNLACWCPLVDEDGNKVPCHADVLLELANAN